MQAAYLLGVADPCSTVATVGVIDAGHLSRSAHLLTAACESVTSAASSKEEVGGAVCGWGRGWQGELASMCAG